MSSVVTVRWVFFFSPKFLTCIQLFATPWTSSDQNAGMGNLSLLGIKPRSPALQVDSLLAEPQGKPKNTGVGNLSLLQQIFPTQESNKGLLCCRRILYQLSHQGVVTVIWVISIAQISGFCLMFCPFVLSTIERDEFQEYLLWLWICLFFVNFIWIYHFLLHIFWISVTWYICLD